MKPLGRINKSVSVTVHPHDVRLIPHTNADKIRHMTDEELAERFHTAGCPSPQKECAFAYNCEKCWLEWLKSEATE